MAKVTIVIEDKPSAEDSEMVEASVSIVFEPTVGVGVQDEHTQAQVLGVLVAEFLSSQLPGKTENYQVKMV